MAKYLKIRNWDRWQSYRKDRGQPPWIKVHRCLMRDEEWVELTDAQRGQLVAIWLLGADRDGVIPASARQIQKLCFMTRPPDLQVFMRLRFIESDVTVTPERRQDDVNVTHQNRIEESREDPPYSPPQGDGVSATSIDEDFNDGFWPNVPTKVGKGAARKAYAQARKKASKEAIHGGLEAYRAYEAKRKRQDDYRPLHPATWLNGERWTDEIPSDRTAKKVPPKPCACGCGREARREREGKLWHTDECWWKTKQ